MLERVWSEHEWRRGKKFYNFDLKVENFEEIRDCPAKADSPEIVSKLSASELESNDQLELDLGLVATLSNIFIFFIETTEYRGLVLSQPSIFRGCIFSHERPFYEQAVSNLYP